MSQRRENKKLKVQPPPPEDMEEDWDSQAEEAEEDSLEDSLEEDSLEEENEEAEEVEEVTADKQLSSAAETSNSATISAPSRGTRRRPSSRWDETGRFPNPTSASKTGKKDRQGYKSWRGHKNAIISCLHECGGNISFTRRYLLFHHGVNFPRNVLHYYRHLHSPYYSQQIPTVSTDKDSGGDLQQKTSSGS
ncbi:L4 encapsidation protein [Human mastadenovirus B]|uniref:L4 encapsidation protein n=2 Tax=Human mastadenovirus B TaxID=108098 RepID=T1UEP2_9ADEN|nr:22K [Human adenovirus 35]AAN17487.1 L4 22K protein [Human adenovirus 35]AGT75724.1 L4 encapsidation protein [Human mastadenovirus B]WEG77725.1 22K [Human adenovirus 35]WOW72195.1 22K protein [Human adenovirus 35]